jgi:hypothetical protein
MEEEHASADEPQAPGSAGTDEGSTERSLSIPEVSELRAKTQAISQLLQQQLQGHLETLRPLFAPRRLIGKYAGGSAARDEVPGAEKAVQDLRARFKAVAGRPFSVKAELSNDLLANVGTQVELYPWEYAYEATSGGQTKTVAITSPVRWVMTYVSNYTLHQLREVVAGREEKRPGDVQQFLANSLVMAALMEKFPALGRLLADLRFEVSVETAPTLGELPLVVLSSNLSSFRPADDLVITATGFSGVNEFVELVDREAVQNLRDPLREKLESHIR